MEFSRRPEERPPRISLISSMNEDPFLWDKVSASNDSYLFAESIKEKAEALRAVTIILGDIDWAGSKVRAAGYAQASQDAELELMSIDDGIYRGVGATSQGICLVVESTDSSGASSNIFFPVRREGLAEFEVEVKAGGGDLFQGDNHFTTIGDEFESCAQDDILRELSPEERLEYLREMLDEYNEELHLYEDASSLTVHCRNYVQNDEDTPGDKYLVGNRVRFILPELELVRSPYYRKTRNFDLVVGSRPLLELRDDSEEDPKVYWIELGDIRDIIQVDDLEDGDLFSLISAEFQAKVLYYEARMAECYGDVDLEELKEESISEIDELLPGAIGSLANVGGYYLEYNPCSKSYDLAVGEFADALYSRVHHIEIGDDWRVVLGFDVTDEHGRKREVFFPPNPDWLSKFRGYGIELSEDYDLIGDLAGVSAESKKMVGGKDFRSSTSDMRIDMLEAQRDKLSEHLSAIDRLSWGARVEWSVRSAICVPVDIASLDIIQSSIAQIRSGSGEPYVFVSDLHDAEYPELAYGDDDFLEGPIAGAKDFKISGGTPMIFAEDRERCLLYIFDPSDVIIVAPLGGAEDKDV